MNPICRAARRIEPSPPKTIDQVGADVGERVVEIIERGGHVEVAFDDRAEVGGLIGEGLAAAVDEQDGAKPAGGGGRL